MIFDNRKLSTNQNNVKSICSMIERQAQFVTTATAPPPPTYLIFHDWTLSDWDWATLLTHIDYLTVRYLDFPGSNFGDTQLETLVNSVSRATKKVLTSNNCFSVHQGMGDPRELADLTAQQERAKKEIEGSSGGSGGAGDFDVGPMVVYLGGSQVTPLKAMLEQEQLSSFGIEWCRLTMEDGYGNE